MKAKIIKRIHLEPQPSVIYSKFIPMDIVPCIGNFDSDTLNKKIHLPRKYFIMTFDDYKKKETRRKYYKNKIKSI